MARPRKNAVKAQCSLPTPDAVAEIPAEEQPYPLPKGWKWVRLSSLCSLRNGKAFKPSDWSDSGLPIVRIQNLNNQDSKFNYYNGHIEDKFLIKSGDLLFAWSGTPGTSFGAHIWLGEKAVLNQHIFRMDFEEKIILKSFFRYSINCRLEELIAKAHGGAGLQHVTKGIFESTPIVLPPLDEQQRIVDRIESLFARLDEAKAKAEDVLDGFEIRKAAILHKAFTGELTAKWRIKNRINIESWEEKKLGSISSLQTGLMKGKKIVGPTVLKPYLRVANVQDGFFNLNEIKQIEVEQQQAKRWTLQKQDVLFTEGGDFDKLGRGAVWEEQIFDCLHQNHIFAVRVNKIVLNPYFLSYQTGSKYGKTYFITCSKQTTNLASINSTQLKSFPVRLPSLPEQQEIVRILDSLLAKEQQIKEAAENVLHQIDLMKKSILARAFRGELGA